MRIAQLNDEAGRLAALNRYCVLDTGPEQAFEKITALVKSVLQVPICAVSLIDKDRQWFKAIQGLSVTQTSREDAFCNHTIRARDALIVRDATADVRFVDNPLVTGDTHIRSYAGVPLETPDGFNLGALCVIDVKSRNFNEAQIDLLKQFAVLVVRELEARSTSVRDPLTGVLTRQGFTDALQHRVSLAQDEGQSPALVIADVDNFRAVNETCGRCVADQVLKQVADCVQNALRTSDVVGRLGGDTFGVILPTTTGYEAFGCAERIRNRIAQLALNNAGDIKISASLGVAGWQRGVGAELWLAEAQGAIFAAKRAGRNCSVNVDKLR
ncbi:MAG TPA: sensor domain-containing diguanylate cyclase [Sphingomonas sp.]|jgi:diguanylate cyclase (GGDEF)-like protein|nr:sensor domain-containing diguanylate cyclase [Sphingomonas sp.]